MYKPADMSLWQGRVDNTSHSKGNALRVHQVIKAWDGISDLKHAAVLLGFACDEGVRRNLGRPGARDGPKYIRKAFANNATPKSLAIYDAGNVSCESGELEHAQQILADRVSQILAHNGQPVVLGGGHEMAWGSFLGSTKYLADANPKDRCRHLGIINFDAHFDLRNPDPHANSGTPFRQMSNYCEEHEKSFQYCVFGINPSANTDHLFEFATQKNVVWRTDINCTLNHLTELEKSLSDFLAKIDDLYVTICLDVFPASRAPGVSAPNALGIDPLVVITALQYIKMLCKKHRVIWCMSDIAELNPSYDIDQHTAKLAARLIHEICC